MAAQGADAGRVAAAAVVGDDDFRVVAVDVHARRAGVARVVHELGQRPVEAHLVRLRVVGLPQDRVAAGPRSLRVAHRGDVVGVFGMIP